MFRRRRTAHPLLLGVGVAVGFTFIFAPQYLGIIEVVRGVALPLADLDNEIDGTSEPDLVYDCPPTEFAHVLGESGFSRNLLSYHATLSEKSGESWVYRDSLFSQYQTHVNTFEVAGKTHLYVHREYNPVRHPVKHLQHPGKPDLDPNGTERVLQLVEPSGVGPVTETARVDVDGKLRSLFARQTVCDGPPSPVRASMTE